MILVELLAPVTVVVDGRVVPVGGTKTRALLARLALDAGRVVSSDRLIDDLWGDDPPVNALNALQVRVSQLRKALRGIVDIVARPPGYVLELDRSEVDALAVEDALGRANSLVEVDASRSSAEFAAALSRFGGAPLGGVGDAPFAAIETIRWEELRLGALEQRIRLELAAGHAGEVLADLERLTFEHPLREPFHELLIVALSAVGRQADALVAFRRVRERLVEELGIDPGPRLVELEHRVLRQDPDLLAAVPATPLPGRTARIEPLIESPPAVDPVRPLAGNVPTPISAFRHRDDDLAAVGRMVVTHRLVTITGPGGAGKTRLALEVARTSAPLTDGIWFVPLETVQDPDLLAPTIASVIGVDEFDAMSALRTRLRAAELLLVLDNCEHLGDAPARVVAEVLGSCPMVRVLATSQRAVGLPGEALWPIGPLPRDEAVEFFVSRAMEVNPRLDFDPTVMSAVERVCEQLDDLPLALELAAARCRVLAVTEIADRLEDRFGLLTDRRAGRVPRHQALAATIGWSYEMLFPDAQCVLQALSCFVGGGPLEGVEQVSGALGVMRSEVLDLLGQLVDRSLVVVDRSDDDRARYRLLESIRAFAQRRADDEGRWAAIRAAHGAWVIEIGANAARCLGGRESNSWEEQRRWLSTLRAQRANFDAAIEWACIHRPADALELASSLFWAWLILGDGAAGAARIERAHEAAKDVTDARSRSLALARTAQLLARVGNVPRAVELSVQALATLPADHATDRAVVESIAGRVYIHAGRFEEGTDLVRRSYVVMEELGDRWSMGMAQTTLGFAAHLCGDIDEGERATLKGLGILGRTIDAWLTHAGHRLLGVLRMTNGDFASALEHLEVALEVTRQMGFRVDEAQTMARVGRVHRLRGDERACIEAFERALLLSREAGDTPSAESVRSQLASVHRAAGHLDRARHIIQRDSSAAICAEQPVGLPSHRLVQLGALALEDGRVDEAGAILARARTLADDEGDLIQRVLARDALARALDAGGAADDATAIRAEAEALALTAAPILDRVERVDRLSPGSWP